MRIVAKDTDHNHLGKPLDGEAFGALCVPGAPLTHLKDTATLINVHAGTTNAAKLDENRYGKRYDHSQPARLFLAERTNGWMDELLSSKLENHFFNFQLLNSIWDKSVFCHPRFIERFTLTYWWILPVQFLLLREEVQTVLQRHLPARAPLGNGQGQIAEHIKSVGVVWAHWAVQRAAQLSREQVCTRKSNRAVNRLNSWTQAKTLSSPTILLSSLSKCLFHMTAASSEILWEEMT